MSDASTQTAIENPQVENLLVRQENPEPAAMIFDAAARLRNRRQQLRLVVPPKSFVGEVLSAVSMEESVPIDSALSDALAAVDSGG